MPGQDINSTSIAHQLRERTSTSDVGLRFWKGSEALAVLVSTK
jgi:hypothetical protein